MEPRNGRYLMVVTRVYVNRVRVSDHSITDHRLSDRLIFPLHSPAVHPGLGAVAFSTQKAHRLADSPN